MFNSETLQKLQEAETITNAHAMLEVANLQGQALALPNTFTLHDLEAMLPNRRRLRGSMNTSFLEAFAAYAETHADDQAACFIDAKQMQAVLILNLGSADKPGHADHTAKLTLEKTAEFKALEKITNSACNQKELAEWMEDWHPHIAGASADGSSMDAKQIVKAVRAIDIKALREVGSTVENLKQTRSTFESVDVSSQHKLPAELTFTCVPFTDLAEHKFQLRLSALTGGDQVKLTIHIRRADAEQQAMAEEFATKTKGVLGDTAVYVGTYSSK
jgi:uncharacterized protein YfdQ (DUF2303 family)